MTRKNRFWRLLAPKRAAADRFGPARRDVAIRDSLRIMDIDWVREFCLSLLRTTEKLQWGDALVFKVGEKMYAVVSLDPDETWISFKCSAEEFAALIERPGVIPAPYLARAQWVALETEAALSRDEIRRLLADAHSLIFAKLPKSTQARLSAAPKHHAPRAQSAAKLERLVWRTYRASTLTDNHLELVLLQRKLSGFLISTVR